MGYTHYWTIARDATQLEWTEIMLLAARIAEKSGVAIDFGGTDDDHLGIVRSGRHVTPARSTSACSSTSAPAATCSGAGSSL